MTDIGQCWQCDTTDITHAVVQMYYNIYKIKSCSRLKLIIQRSYWWDEIPLVMFVTNSNLISSEGLPLFNI